MKIRCSVILGVVLVFFALINAANYATAKTSKKHHTAPVVQAPADPVSGLWYTEDRDGGIELFSCGAQICGRFYWLKDDEENGDISRDTHNPDHDKRGRALCGLQFMTGFVPDGNGHYAKGTIYSPRHGANFSAEMTLADHDTLNLRGYMIFSFLGETQTWKRATTIPKCKPEGSMRPQ